LPSPTTSSRAPARQPLRFGAVGHEFQRHRDVLPRGRETQQVVVLQNEADASAQADPGGIAGTHQLLSEHGAAAYLHGPQSVVQGQQRGFAAAGRAGQQHDLARRHGQPHVVQHRAGSSPVP
jgi:hypothetical protein